MEPSQSVLRGHVPLRLDRNRRFPRPPGIHSGGTFLWGGLTLDEIFFKDDPILSPPENPPCRKNSSGFRTERAGDRAEHLKCAGCVSRRRRTFGAARSAPHGAGADPVLQHNNNAGYFEYFFNVSIRSRPIRRLTPHRRTGVGRPSLKGGITEKDFIGFAVLSTPLFPEGGGFRKGIFDKG